jgi:anti-anti-sigma regulatory factor
MTSLVLAPVLDLTAAPALKHDLLEAFAGGDAVTIDAGQVQRIASPCLQLLVAAVVQGASLFNISPAFGDTAGALDLVQALKLEGPHG